MDNEYLLNKITQILKDKENNLFTGTITNPKLFSECNITRDSDKLSITAINLNCISPGKVIVVKDIDDNKYYCFSEIENNINTTKNILYRKTTDNEHIKANYYLENADLKNILNGKRIYIGNKTITVTSKKLINIKKLKDNKLENIKEDIDKITTDYALEEHKHYLISYSDSCDSYKKSNFFGQVTTNTKKYYSLIDEDNKFIYTGNINNLPVKDITNKTSFYVTNFTPFTLYSFVSNINGRANTDLSRFFTESNEILKRDKKKYNPNFYYIWRLIESGDGDDVTYAFGWVNLDGILKPVQYNYEADIGCKLNTNYVFRSNNDYNGYMRIDIGGMDRTTLILDTHYSPRILFPITSTGYALDTHKSFGNTLGGADTSISSVNNAIYDPL